MPKVEPSRFARLRPVARKQVSRPSRSHAAVRSILDEAQKQEIVGLAKSPDRIPPESAVKRLGAVKVQELDGSEVQLGSLWKECAAAVVWLRHYG
jgi:hypothetical protein